MHDHTTDSGISLPLVHNFLSTLAILPTAIVILLVRVGLRQFAPSILTPHSLIISKTILKAQGQILMKKVPSIIPPQNSLARRVRIFSLYRQVVTSDKKTTLPPTWHSCRILIHQQMSLSLAPSFMKQRMVSGGGRSRRYRAVAPRMTRSVGNQYSSRIGAEVCSFTQTLIQCVSYYCSSQSKEKRHDLSQPSSPIRYMARVQPCLEAPRIRIIIQPNWPNKVWL